MLHLIFGCIHEGNVLASSGKPSEGVNMIANRGVPRQRSIINALIAASVTMNASASFALVIQTSDPAQVAAFQSGATIENFDDLAALTITSYASGQTVPAASQFSSRNLVTFSAPFFNSGGASFNDPIGNAGTPIGIFDPDGAIAGDVKSLNNVAGPLAGGSDQAFGNGFMEVIFPTDMRRIGVWVTHGTFTIFLKDSTNTNLASGDVSVTGSAGQFIGIQRNAADVRGLTIGFPESFTFDDFTFSTTPISEPVPEPASIFSAALGLGALLGLRRKANRQTSATSRLGSGSPGRNAGGWGISTAT
jgi:hypothetical protein